MVGAIAASFYVTGGYVWDDITLIERDLVSLDLGGIAALWTSPIRDEGPGAAYFRPFALTAMAVLGRAGPWAIHLATLVLHAGSCFLLTHSLRGTRWPLLGGVVFAVHPLTSEVLAWCSALPDALAVFLALLSVHLWARATGSALVLLLMACLSKETALLIPLIYGMATLLPRRWWVLWFFVSACAGAMRLGMGVAMSQDWMSKLEMAPAAILWSLGSLIWPFPLTAVRDLWMAPTTTMVGGGLVVALMVYWARRDRRALSGVVLVLAGPTLALPVMLDGYLVAERYMYVSLVGLALWLSVLVPPPSRQRWLWLPVLGSLLVHGWRAADWRSSLTLFQQAVEAQPESSYAWHFLGVSLAENDMMSDAADAFEKAVATGHPHPLDRFFCLKALVLSGRLDEAVRWAQQGPQDELTAESIAWRARAHFLTGDFRQALVLLELLQTPDGYDGPPWVNELFVDVQQEIETSRMLNP